MIFDDDVKHEFQKLLEKLPNTVKMPRYVSAAAAFLSEKCKRHEYATYDEVAEHLGVKNPRHKSLSLALLALVVEDVQKAKGWRSAIVVGKASGIPGPGFFNLIRMAGVAPENEIEAWQGELLMLGFKYLPNGERISLPDRRTAAEHIEFTVRLDEETANGIMALSNAKGWTAAETVAALTKFGLDVSQQSKKFSPSKKGQ